MTVEDALRFIGNATTDDIGHIASFVFNKAGTLGHLQARLDKSDGDSPALWKVVWTVHWRSSQGQEQRESSTDPRRLLARFGHVNLETTPSHSLEDLLKQD